MLPRKFFDFHMRLNTISCLLRAVFPQNVVIKSKLWTRISLVKFCRMTPYRIKPSLVATISEHVSFLTKGLCLKR